MEDTASKIATQGWLDVLEFRHPERDQNRYLDPVNQPLEERDIGVIHGGDFNEVETDGISPVPAILAVNGNGAVEAEIVAEFQQVREPLLGGL